MDRKMEEPKDTREKYKLMLSVILITQTDGRDT